MEELRAVQLVSNLGGQPQSLWTLAFRRLLRSPRAWFGMMVLVLFILLGALAPLIAPYPVFEIHLDFMSRPPFWMQASAYRAGGDTHFLLGTDSMGRDLLSWALYGTRTSMTVGLVSALLISLLGTGIGLLSGYVGGRLDWWLMRLADVFYALPTFMFYILIVMALRDTAASQWMGGVFILLVAYCAIGWVGLARLVRSQVMVLKNIEFVEAAECAGARRSRILYRHLLPNCLGVVLVWVTMAIPQFILTEAMLGYVGIQLGPRGFREMYSMTSWGGMILEGRNTLNSQPYLLGIPTVCVGVIALACSVLGDALRDVVDPRKVER